MKTVIEMAREAGFRIYNEHTGRNTEKTFIAAFDMIERFAELVRADERERIIAANATEIEKINAHIKALEAAVIAEREACAKVCEPWLGRYPAIEIMNAIRARGQA